MALPASSSLSGPTGGWSKSRSAYDFDSPAKPGNLWEPCTHDDDRQVELRDLVQRHDESAEFFLVQILHLIYAHANRDIFFRCGFTDCDEEVGKILFEVATVRSAPGWFDSEFRIVPRNVHRAHEAAQSPQCLSSFVTRRSRQAERKQ